MSILNLKPDETILFEKCGDYWTGGLLSRGQTGVFLLTNQRFAFRFKILYLIEMRHNSFEINLSDVSKVEKCCVGPGFLRIIPTGVKITTKNGQKVIASVLGRGKLLKALEDMNVPQRS